MLSGGSRGPCEELQCRHVPAEIELSKNMLKNFKVQFEKVLFLNIFGVV